MSKVRIEDNMPEFISKNTILMDSALNRAAKDIAQLAKIKVPFKKGNLMKEIEPRKTAELKHRVQVDSDYASYQERGRRKDGSHVVRKYTTPNTSAHFLRNAGDTVSQNMINYFKQANQLLKI